jgi:hypothetical protein
MDWKEAELSKIMFVGEKLIWGLKAKIITPQMLRTFNEWFDEHVFFTDRRILILWDVKIGNLLEIPYDSISAINPEGAPGSGGIAGVKTQVKGGGVIGIGSTYGNVRIQFPDAESLKYGQWLLNEAPRGTQLSPGAETPIIQGQVDPNATPQPPKQKSGCFVATATYGSPMAEEVMTLRSFRDQVLCRYSLGRKMIEIYHIISPPIADFVSRYPRSRCVSRLFLAPIIYLAKCLTGKQQNQLYEQVVEER